MVGGRSKVFVGGLTQRTSSTDLKEYFGRYGHIKGCEVMNDRITGKSRGFGFVIFHADDSVARVLAEHKTHIIDKKWVDVKAAVEKPDVPAPLGGVRRDLRHEKSICAKEALNHVSCEGDPTLYEDLDPRLFILPDLSDIYAIAGDESEFVVEPNGFLAAPADDVRDVAPELKIFVGGLTQQVTSAMLEDHFRKYGQVASAHVKMNPTTNQSRGFGFVIFAHAMTVRAVLDAKEDHQIDNKWVEVKQSDQLKAPLPPATKKIFLGGLPTETTEEDVMNHFSRYGIVERIVIKKNEAGEPRGFGFVIFDHWDTVRLVLQRTDEHKIREKWIEVKEAVPGPNQDKSKVPKAVPGRPVQQLLFPAQQQIITTAGFASIPQEPQFQQMHPDHTGGMFIQQAIPMQAQQAPPQMSQTALYESIGRDVISRMSGIQHYSQPQYVSPMHMASAPVHVMDQAAYGPIRGEHLQPAHGPY